MVISRWEAEHLFSLKLLALLFPELLVGASALGSAMMDHGLMSCVLHLSLLLLLSLTITTGCTSGIKNMWSPLIANPQQGSKENSRFWRLITKT